MTISSISAGQMTGKVNFGGGQGRPSEAQMKEGLDQLRKSNPELAAKMEKIQTRMQELQKGGTSIEDAMKTIESEFGKPSESEMKSMGGPPKGMRMQLGGGGQMNLGALLGGSNSIKNTDIMSLFSQRSNED